MGSARRSEAEIRTCPWVLKARLSLVELNIVRLGTENVQAGLLDTRALCDRLLKPGSVYEFLAEHRRELFSDQDFAGLFPSERGRLSIPASRIASVMVL